MPVKLGYGICVNKHNTTIISPYQHTATHTQTQTQCGYKIAVTRRLNPFQPISSYWNISYDFNFLNDVMNVSEIWFCVCIWKEQLHTEYDHVDNYDYHLILYFAFLGNIRLYLPAVPSDRDGSCFRRLMTTTSQTARGISTHLPGQYWYTRVYCVIDMAC